MRYFPHTREEIASMLKYIGAENLESLFSSVPRECLTDRSLYLPEALTEWELTEKLESLSSRMATMPDWKIYLGGGSYEHFVPSVVQSLLGRSEFYTAYTPYQPEVSQGTLQGIYEYQTLMCRIFGMEVSNGSMYDGASALAEALLMAMRVTGRKKVAVSKAIHPFWREVVRTYIVPSGHEIVEIPFNTETGLTEMEENFEDFAAVAVQSPNFFGCIEDLGQFSKKARSKGALFVTAFSEPLAYGILKSPGSQGADIICGEGKSFGLGQTYGGMNLGIFASRREYIRNMPGRIVGKTVDKEGRRGFVITLATREQHIRREKATSNICSNQSLCAIGAAMYLALAGKKGLSEIAKSNYDKSEYLKELLIRNGAEPGFSSSTFNEFTVKLTPEQSAKLDTLTEKKIIAGMDIGRFYPELSGWRLFCATETKTANDLKNLAEEVGRCLRG